MSGNYNTEGKNQKLARLYGLGVAHSGNGKFIEHLAEAAPGGGVSVKARLALGESPFSGIRKVYYDNIEIAPQYWQFHKESGNVVPSNTMFATRPLVAGASFIDINLPPGMNIEDRPDKIIAIAEGLEVADYNGNGSQTNFNFSMNAARICADALLFTPDYDISDIDWGSWVEYKAFCAENITVNIDGANQQLPRFSTSIFAIPPFDKNVFLDRICQMTCSDWTTVRGKIRFLPAVSRAPEFDFNPDNIVRAFNFPAIETENRFNGVRVLWRDELDPFLEEQEPIVIDRRIDPNEPENFYELNMGTCRRDVAVRAGHYWAKQKCDLTDFAAIRASRKSYITVPGYIATVTHPDLGWTNKRVKIIKKIEADDRKTVSGIEKFEGYTHFVQVEPVNPYSDTDTAPIQTRTPVTGPNPFAAPPSATLQLQQRTNPNNNGTSSQSVFGTVTFGAFAGRQFARVFWLKPGATIEEQIENNLLPDANNQVTFEKHNLAVGTHFFRIVTFNADFYTTNQGAGGHTAISITHRNFFVDEFNVPLGLGRAFTGLNPQGNYTGTDTAAVPRDRIVVRVSRGTTVDNGLNVDCTITGDVTGQKIDPASQGETIFRSYTEVYNKFGELIHTFAPEGFQGSGTIADGVYLRKYSDAFEEATFKVLIQNRAGISLPVYLTNGSTVSNNPPVWKLRADCPLEVQATPLTSNSISFSGSFNFSGKTLKLQTREIGQRFADWQDYVTGISAFPFVATGFPADKEMEFRFVSSQGVNNSSNIVRAKTFQVGQNAPARPAPGGIAIAPRSDNPYQHLRATWTRNATDNTGVQIDVGGTISNLPANQELNDFLNIGEGQSRTVRVRNTWDSGVPYSEWTEYKTGTTQVTPPANYPPANLQASYDQGTNTANFNFNYGTDAGAHTLEESDNNSNWSDVQAVNSTNFSRNLQQTTYQYSKFYRLRNNANGLRSNTAEVVVPVQENNGWEHPEISSAFSYTTGQFTAQVEGNFVPRGGTGGFAVYFDEQTGSSMTFAQQLAANQTYFSFQVNRPFNNSFIYVYVYRDDVYSESEPIKYTVEIEGTYGGEIN